MKMMSWKRVKRILAAFMAILMIITMMPETSIMVFAANNESFEGQVVTSALKPGTNDEHSPIEGASVWVVKGGFTITSAKTDENGDYTLNIPNYDSWHQSDYKVFISADGFRKKENENLYQKAVFYLESDIKLDQDELVWENEAPEELTWEETLDCTVSGGSGTGEITYDYDNEAIVDKIEDGVFYFKASGDITITAIKAGDPKYNKTETAPITVKVNKVDQKTKFEFEVEDGPHITTYETPYSNKAIGGDTGKITYRAEKEDVVSIDAEGIVTPLATTDSITIYAISEGDERYFDSEEISYDLTINPGASTVEFQIKEDIPNLKYKDTYINTAKAYDKNHNEISDAKIIYSIYREGDDQIIEIVDEETGEIKGKKQGTAYVLATFVDERYEKSDDNYMIEVEKIDQEITFDDGDAAEMSGDTPSTIYSNEEEKRVFYYVAHSSAEEDGFTLKPTYTVVSSENENGESIVGENPFLEDGSLVYNGAGTITVNAHFDGNDCYNAADKTYTLTVKKYQQNLVFLEGNHDVILNDSSSYNTFTYMLMSETNNVDDVYYTVVDDPDEILDMTQFNERTGSVVLKPDLLQGVDGVYGQVKIRATKPGDINYLESSDEGIVTFKCTVYDPGDQTLYTIGGPRNKGITDWFCGSVSITPAEDYYITEYQRHGWTDIIFHSKEGKHKPTFWLRKKDEPEGRFYVGWDNLPYIQIDSVKPSQLAIKVGDEQFGGNKKDEGALPRFISKSEKEVRVLVQAYDATSGINVDNGGYQYCVVELAPREQYSVLSPDDLEINDFKWSSAKKYETYENFVSKVYGSFKLAENKRYVLYVKVMDEAGNAIYGTTDEVIYDNQKPTIVLTSGESEVEDYKNYTGNVSVDVAVKDNLAGIKSISYEVWNGDTKTQSDTLYDRAYYDNKQAFSLSEKKNFVIDASNNSNDDIKIKVVAVDYADQTNTVEKCINIYAKEPSIKIDLSEEKPEDPIVDGVAFYHQQRKATITITGRQSGFINGEKKFEVIAVDKAGNPVTSAYSAYKWSDYYGNTPDEDTHVLEVFLEKDAKYDITAEFTDAAGQYVSTRSPEVFVIDQEAPTGTLIAKVSGENGEEIGSWNQNLVWNERHFGIWQNQAVTVSAVLDDNMSGIKSVQYLTTDSVKKLSSSDLDALQNSDWMQLEKGQAFVTFSDDQVFSMYVKITDYSGNITYVCTDGIIVDHDNPDITLSYDNANANGVYNHDLSVKISAKEEGVYSGIKELEYWIEVDGECKKHKVLYKFDETKGLTYDKLLSATETYTIEIDKDDYNSDDVKLFVKATDNAGNVSYYTPDGIQDTEGYVPLRFSATAPKINIKFGDEMNGKSEDGKRAYYDHKRVASVVLVGRKSLFDQTRFEQGMVVSASNSEGPITLQEGDVVFEYVGERAGKDGNEKSDLYEIEYSLRFNADANYDFLLSYVDLAGNACVWSEDEDEKPEDLSLENRLLSTITFEKDGRDNTDTDRFFTVDTTKPVMEIEATGRVWTTLLERLTYGLWSADAIEVSAKASDATSPIKEWYFKTSSVEPYTSEELDELPVDAWKLYVEPIAIEADERFVVYYKVADAAGNYDYICTDGIIFKKDLELDGQCDLAILTDAKNPEELAKDSDKVGIYNEDVKLKISASIREPKEGEIDQDAEDKYEPYSGIHKVEYWIVTNEGKEYAEESDHVTLYQFDYVRADGEWDDSFVNGEAEETGRYVNSNSGKLTVYEKFFDEDGTVSEDTKVYLAEEGNYPNYDQLKYEIEKTITINAEKYNCSDVTVYVKITDNAKNEYVDFVKMDIDVTAPAIEVSYDNDNAKKMDKDRGYFPADRTATIVITERTDHFEQLIADGGITITAVNAKGEGVPVIAKVIGKDKGKIEIVPVGNASEPGTVNLVALGDIWKTVKKYDESGDKKVPVPDGDTHTLIIHYDADANYEFSIKYADKATNPNQEVDYGKSVAPNEFTVDRKNPFGEITAKEVIHDDSAAAAQVVREIHTWKDLIKVLTFGIWTKADISVAANWNDETSKTEQAMYYQAPDNKALTSSELDKVTGWVPFAKFELEPNAQRTVYLRVTDYAGNRTYISTNAMILDNVAPGADTLQPSIGVAATASADIYSGDVPVSVTVSDPKTDEAFSGLKKVSYIVTNMGTQTQNGVLYAAPEVTNNGIDNEAEVGKDENGNPRFFTYEELEKTKSFSGSLTVEAAKNNSNDVRVVVLVEDKAGNTFEKDIRLKIDITKPTIKVSYDNNEGDVTFANPTTDAYFKAPRTATVVITERNFDPNRVNFTIQNSDGAAPAISGWTTVGNGDGTTHTATIVYSADGDYGFDVGVIDQAGNGNQGVDYSGSLAPQKFTVDRTIPKIAIEYDNNDAKNGNYYKETRTATVTITERNFETSRIRVTMTASDDGTPIPVPVVSAWTNYGERHVARIEFADDARYSLDVDYADKAGNESENMEAQVFYVDLTAPVLRIDNILDESANGGDGDVGFVMTATDVNLESFVPKLTATVREGDGFTTKVLQIGTTEDIKNGKVFTVSNLEDDGIYHVECTLVDKAGNAYEQVILVDKNGKDYVARRSAGDKLVSFSVNRLGSTYELDDATRAIVEKYYLRNLEHDLTLIEINADPLKNRSVTVNGRELTEGTDYTVKESGGKGKWYRYEYVIRKELFEPEGEYVVVCSSKDKADNDAFNDVKGVNARFVIDRTPPVVAVTGLSEKGRYQTENQVVTIVPTDDGGALKSLVVSLVEKNGEVVGELLSLEDDKLEQALEENGGALTFTVPEGLYQNVKIVAKDQAGSDEEEPNTFAQTITNVSVTPSGFLIFWANKPARFGAMGGIAAAVALVVLLLFWKKKRGYRR